MVDRLEVDLDGLTGLADRLDGIRSQLGSTRTGLDAVRGDLGSSEVEHALDGFEHRWRDGREKIDKTARTLTSMLTESVRAYRASDEQLAGSLHGSATATP